MHAHDEVEILDDAVCAIAAYRHDVFFAKQAERSGDDQIAAQAVPSQPAEQKRAQILDHLNSGDQLPGHARVRHAPVRHGAVVGDAHRAADRGDLAAEQERAREAQQGVRLDERIGIDGDHERKA